MVGFILFWLLALHGPSVQGVSISNSTRTTTERLWTMALEDSDIYNMAVQKLKGYAIDCCTNPKPPQGYGLGKTQTYCAEKQIAYWAYIDRRVYAEYPNKPAYEVLEEWLDYAFNPKRALDHDEAVAFCLGRGNINEPYPYFAIADTSSGDEGHTEAQLLGPMSLIAEEQTLGGYRTDFFMYTYQSPCGSPFPENCQKKIFQFTFDDIYPFHQEAPFPRIHSLAVGFEKWYTPGTPPIAISKARNNFCDSVTDIKNNNEYQFVDFYTGLFLKKITNEKSEDNVEDDDYRPGAIDGVNRC